MHAPNLTLNVGISADFTTGQAAGLLEPVLDEVLGPLPFVDVVVSNVVMGDTYTLQYVDAWPPGVWANVPGAVSIPAPAATMVLADINIVAQTERYYRVWGDVEGAPSMNEAGVYQIQSCNGGTALYGMPLMPTSNGMADVIGFQMSGSIPAARISETASSIITGRRWLS